MKKLLGIIAVVFAAFALIACSPKTANVTLDVNGGDALSQTEYVVTVGEPAELPTPTKTGHDFLGWNNAADGTAVDVSNWSLEGDVTLVAQWQAKTCNINLDANGGTLVGSNVLSVSYGANLSALPGEASISREGYDFLGWFDANDNEITTATRWTTVAETTLTAKWSGKMVSYVLDPNGGTVEGQLNGQFFMGAAISAIPTPVKPGYDFVGWKLNGADLGATWETWSQTPVTIKAEYTAKTYTLVLNIGEGTGATSYDVTFGQPYEIPAPTAPQYTEFSNWTMNGQPIAASGNAWSYADPTELTAVYGATHYFLTFEQEGVQDIVVPVALGSAIETVPTVSAIDGYMVQWTIDGTSAASNDDIKALRETTTITVLKTAKTYTVHFDAGDGSITEGEATMNIVFASEPVLPVAAKEGHTFHGWVLAGSDVPVSGAWNIHEADGSIDLVALYTANTYTITYVVDEYTQIADNTLVVTYGEEYTLDTNVTCEHADFIKWQDKDGNDFANTGVYNIADDVKLYPVLNGKYFDVVYVVDGVETAKSLQYGASITETYGIAPSKGAHIFDGWIIDGKFYDKDAKSDIIANGKRVVAHFVPDNNYGPAV